MKVLADGKLKWTILTTKPADIGAPVLTELSAGVEASLNTLTSDFSWSNTASATFDEKPLAVKGQAQALGISNYDLAATFIREYAEAGGPDTSGEDAAYQAVKEKGTVVWAYARETDADSTAPWAEGDEIYLGGEVMSDTPARVNNDGNIKRRVVLLPQDMRENIVVAAAAV